MDISQIANSSEPRIDCFEELGVCIPHAVLEAGEISRGLDGIIHDVLLEDRSRIMHTVEPYPLTHRCAVPPLPAGGERAGVRRRP